MGASYDSFDSFPALIRTTNVLGKIEAAISSFLASGRTLIADKHLEGRTDMASLVPNLMLIKIRYIL